VGPALSLIHIHIYHFIQTILGGANHFPWGKYLPIPSKQCHGSAPLVNSYLSIINGAVLQQNTIWTTFSCLNTGACVSVASTPRPPEGCERDLSFCLSCGGRKALMLEKKVYKQAQATHIQWYIDREGIDFRCYHSVHYLFKPLSVF
jgi:hypothetical protein